MGELSNCSTSAISLMPFPRTFQFYIKIFLLAKNFHSVLLCISLEKHGKTLSNIQENQQSGRFNWKYYRLSWMPRRKNTNSFKSKIIIVRKISGGYKKKVIFVLLMVEVLEK